MPRMSELELRLWRERLSHADRVWADHGYSRGTTEGSRRAKTYLNAYRGVQWDFPWGGLPEEELVTDNVVFEVVNTVLAQIYARHPVVDVMATNPQLRDNARRMERLVNHLVQSPKLKQKRQVNRALFDATVLHFGVIRVGFTPASEKLDDQGKLIEFYDPARPDFPWLRRWPVWDFRADPLAESFDADGDARWCAFRSLDFLDQVRRNPGLINRQDLKPTANIEDVGFGKLTQSPDQVSVEHKDLVEIWTIFDKVDRKWFAISPGSDKPLRNPDDWPEAFATLERLPYGLLMFNETTDDPFGSPYSEQILPLQVELNKVWTIAHQLMKRMRRIIGVNREELADGEWDKITQDMDLCEFIETKNLDPGRVFSEVRLGGSIQELVLWGLRIRDIIREKTGVSEMDRAQRINVETATEAGAVQAGSSVQRGRNQGPFEDFFSDVISMFGQALQQSLTDAVAIPIVGAEDADALFSQQQETAFERITPKQIEGEFTYSVRPGSSLPRDPQQEMRQELALNEAIQPFGELVNLAQRAFDTMRAFDKDPSKQLAPVALQRMRQLIAAQQGIPPGTPTDGGGGGIDAQTANLLANPNRGGG